MLYNYSMAANLKSQQAGGRATAIIARKQACERYYASPNYCKHCGAVIELRPNSKTRDARIKKFCNHICAASHSNKIRLYTKPKKKRVCANCAAEFLNGRADRRFCDPCSEEYKNRLAVRSLAKATHSEIRSHARATLKNTPAICFNCGYDKFVEVCHINPVKSFPETALLKDANHIDNLVKLCPNCHWEFDHGILKLLP